MTQKTVIVKIGPDGTVKMETFGFVGAECEQATKGIEGVLGGARSQELKPEYHQHCEVGEHLKAGQ